MIKEIRGVYTSAIIFTEDIEQSAVAQIQHLCDSEAAKGSKIRIMPDVHPGKFATIGTTMTILDKVIPNITGADIGCGMTCVKIKKNHLEGKKLDTVIREKVPSGMAVRKNMHRYCLEMELKDLCCFRHIDEEKAWFSLGTLGGGNHFIEIDQDEEGDLYLVIHSGSRHLGAEVCKYYQNLAYKQAKKKGINTAQPVSYLEGEALEDYLSDLTLVQEFASLNRACIVDEIIKGMGFKIIDQFETIHNYIDFTEEYSKGVRGILRKGAVSAKENERLIIPINMKEGILLCTGKGNIEWNCSAPHGAGRRYSRDEVKKRFTVSAFQKQMKGIYCSCISSNTLDEAPFAYRTREEIEKEIKDTVTVDKVLQPIYNFKAQGKG